MNLRAPSLLLCAALLSPGAQTQGKLPADVARFVEQRDGCDHFRSEEAYDADRRKFLVERVRELCTGTDARLKALKEKYKAHPEIRSRLDTYEPQIE